MKEILIMGGTGAMGTHLVDICSQLGGVNCVVTSRRPRVSNASNVKYVCGDAHQMDFLKSLLQGKHYDAIVDFMTYTTPDFKRRYQLFLDATDQYFFLSTSRVYAEADIITEDSPRLLDVTTDTEWLKTDEYALCKARQEDILRASGRKNFTIIRPYMTYSQNRLQLGIADRDTFVYRALKGRAIIVSNDIMQHTTTLTYGYDVAQCIYRLIGNPKAYGEAFHPTTSETIPWMDVLKIYVEAIERKTGRKQKVVLTEHSSQLTYPIQRYQVMYDRCYDRRFDNSKILSAIDEYEFTSPREGLKKCIDGFLNAPNWGGISPILEATNDYYSHEWSGLGEFKSIKSKIAYCLYRMNPVIAQKVLRKMK